MTHPTAGIDAAIAHAWEDVQAARAAHALRPTMNTAHNIEAYQDSLDRLLDARPRYTAVSPH